MKEVVYKILGCVFRFLTLWSRSRRNQHPTGYRHCNEADVELQLRVISSRKEGTEDDG